MADIAGIGFVVFLAGSAALGAGRKILERRRARRVLRAQTPLAATSPEGVTVRATGIARVAEHTLEAPLSGRTCLVARSRVFSGKGLSAMGERPKESITMVPFILDRGDEGQVLVEGEHVLLDLPPIKMQARDINVERQQLFMALHGVQLRNSTVNFEETLVEPGDRISVAGLVMKDVAEEPADHERGFRDAMPTRLRLAGDLAHPLAIGRPVD